MIGGTTYDQRALPRRNWRKRAPANEAVKRARLPRAATESLEARWLRTTFYVDTNNAAARDSNAGTSIAQPLKTINQAFVLAGNNNSTSQSDTILIRAGTYHEQPSIWTTDSGASATSRTVVSAYVNPATGKYEPVYIDAADSTPAGWIRDGTSNRWYLNNFTAQTAGVWVDWSPSADGASLQQIGGYNGETSTDRKIVGANVSDMYAGTYFGDRTTNRLYVWLADGGDPNSHSIEYANRSRAIYEPGTAIAGGFSYVNYIDFKGLNLRHANVYNTIGQDPGCATYTEGDQRLIDCNVQWNTRDGVHLLGNSQMINCVASNNGGNGVAAKGNGFLIIGGQYDYNYWRQYNDGGNAAIKAITNNPLIYGNIENIESSYNYGKGIWFDTCFENSVVSQITGNYIHDNQDAGLNLEASRNYLVANNIIVNNQAGGIVLNAVENARLYNNTIIGNYGIAAIELDGGTRDQGSVYPGTIGMLNIHVEDNIIANNFTVYDLDIPTSAAPSAEINNNTSDYNLFYRRGGPLHFSTGGTYLGGWGSTPSTLALWQAASGQDHHSAVLDPRFFAGGNGPSAYELGINSPAIGAGAVLSPFVTTDFAGNARSTAVGYDIGAYQYVSGGAGVPGPIINNLDPSVWVDDQLPDNAAMTAPEQNNNSQQNRFWKWNSVTVYSGAASLDSTVAAGVHRQYFTGADPRIVGSTDSVSAYVYIDPANVPSQIMFEWQDQSGSWKHQAYWGQNLISGGVDGSVSGQYVGPLPAAGAWTLLSVPASVVGLAGQQITGFSFDLYNGRALLDKLGNSTAIASPVLSGTVFQDNNGNGQLDTGEPGIGGQTVFLDLNNDGSLDPGDPSAITDSIGRFTFYNLSAGTYTVGQILPEGVISSTYIGLGYPVTLAAGVSVIQNFGDFPSGFTSSFKGDDFIVALSVDQGRVNIWEDTPESSAPTYSIDQSQLTQLAFSAGSYGGSLTVDYINGAPLFSDAIYFDGGSQAGNLSIMGTRAFSSSFVVYSSAITVDWMNVDFTNIGSLTVAGGTQSDVLTLSSGAVPVVFNGGGGNDTLNVAAGNYAFSDDPHLDGTSLTVNVEYGASVTFAANPVASGLFDFHLAALNLSFGATATIAASGGPSNRTLLILNSLSFDLSSGYPEGLLDVENADVIIYGGDVTAISTAIHAGYSNGMWNGRSGMLSSLAASDTSFLTAVGIATGIGGSFDGQPVSADDVLLKYTYVGDINLDGMVDGSDYSRIDFGALSNASGWYNGDLNFDGVVDGSDYSLIDNAYNQQGTSLAAQVMQSARGSDPKTAALHSFSANSPDGLLNDQNIAGISAVLRSAEYVWTDPAMMVRANDGRNKSSAIAVPVGDGGMRPVILKRSAFSFTTRLRATNLSLRGCPDGALSAMRKSVPSGQPLNEDWTFAPGV